jgi:bifunctional non-homologous end joining protein LigD
VTPAQKQALRVGRRTVEITHPDKVLFPAIGFTKLDLARYYERVADTMLPHVRNRPVSMQCFPDGVEGNGFFLKNAPPHFPDWIERVSVPKRGGRVAHVLCNHTATLVYLANQNAITPHVWTSRADRLRRPDRLIFDLDPTDEDFAAVRSVARRLGDVLRALGLKPFAMTTGSRGLHVVVPLRRTAPFGEVRRFARAVADVLVAEDPDRLTTEPRKASRRGRMFVDVLRNGYAQTAVPPYAVRARARAPVATPLRWEELDDRRLYPQRWTTRNVFRRLNAGGDPWRGISRHARSLDRARRELRSFSR